jgi:hypothetical protein
MAAGVAMNNSPTSHRQNNTPQTTSSTKLNAPGVQPQGTSGARSALEDAVDRVLDRAKSRLEVDDAQAAVETLEKVSRKHSLPIYRRIEPVDDRCWTPALESTCAPEGDVSGDS